MRKSDFALISALYDSKNGGLYSDVYFPIIKYTLVNLFYQKKQQDYYTHKNVQDFIKENFGIEIPTLVLKKAIVAVNSKSDDFELEIFDNGAEFKILKAWDFSVNADIDAKAHVFDTHIDNLESEYRKYAEAEGIEIDKTFLDFISDNTDDILGYFENESIEKIDSEYAVMAYFLRHLQTSSPELFRIASELFWGSIIAGFLKREKINSLTCEGNATEYFLDTPIVMGLLKLSTDENETYSSEVIDIIKASGGLPKIHPITMEEVRSIITSVENADYPIPNTPMEAAWLRDALTKSKLAQRRVTAESDLEGFGVIHFPAFSQQEIIKVKKQYTSKPDVKALTKDRGGISSDRGIFRDIHDVFMDDYIEDRRKTKGTDDCCFFVTTNTDLVRFCKGRKMDSRMRTIGSSRIILELWMHNTKQSGLQISALTEMIARCIDMNSRDVRNKLGIVSKYYNATKQKDFDLKVFQEIARCLYKRDKDVIAAVEDLKSDNEAIVDVNVQIIVEKAHESSIQSSNKLSDIQKQVNSLQKQLAQAEQEKQTAIETGKEESERSKGLQDELIKSKETSQKQGEALKKYAEKEKLSKQREDLEKELDVLENEKSAYVKKHDHYKLYLTLEVFLLVALASSVIYGGYQLFTGGSLTIAVVVAILSSLIPALTLLTRKSLFVIERQALHDDIKVKAENLWLSMNPEYKAKKNQLSETTKKISELDDEIRTITLNN